MVESDIHLLELANGIKDTLISSGFSTIKSILESTNSDLSSKIGVDQYVAQIILEEAKRFTTEITKVPPSLDDNTFDALAVAVRKEDFLSYP
jgi:hypothetical protein